MAGHDDAVVVEPAGTHKASVIWLHGLGADGHDFEPIVPELRLPDDAGTRFIFPNAPVRPVTINGGMAMRAWYDIRSPDLSREEDADAIIESAGIVNGFIDREKSAGIESRNIILAGFSQGGAVALHAGLRRNDRLAGILALSTYLPLPERLSGEARAENRDTPILMAHGSFDPVIPVTLGKNSCTLLQQAGYPVEWHTYPMQHAVCPDEIDVIGRWLKSCLDLDGGPD